MKQDVLVNLGEYLNSVNNVNARLLSAIINDARASIMPAEIDELQPILLCALGENAGTEEAVATLRAELGLTHSRDWQIMYLRYKMGMLERDMWREVVQPVKRYFCTLALLHEEMSVDLAYMILLFVEQMMNEQVEQADETYVRTLQTTLPACLLRSGKQYNLIEFSILAEALAVAVQYFERDFVAETIHFIADLQTSKGNFGFQDPFFANRMKEEDALLVSMHVGLAYHKLVQTWEYK